MRKTNRKTALQLQKTKIAKLNNKESSLIIGGNVNKQKAATTSICLVTSSLKCILLYTTGG